MRISGSVVAVLMAVAVMASTGFAGSDVVSNPSFERDDWGWQWWGDGDLKEEYYGVSAQDGSKFLRLWKRSGWYQDFKVKSGERFEVSAYVATSDGDALWGDATGEIKIEWRKDVNGEDAEAGEAVSVFFDAVEDSGQNIPKGIWTRLALPIVTAPQGATRGRILFTIWTDDDKGGGCALFDNLRLEKLP